MALFLFIVLTLSWFLFFLKWRESVERYDTAPPEPQDAAPSSLHPPADTGDLAMPFRPDETTAAPPGFDFSELGLRPHAGRSNRAALESLRLELEALPADEAIAQLLDWLESGIDLDTGIWFELSAGGHLAGAPSFRTFVIDQIARIDPVLAAEQAETAFRNELPRSADEFALHLRNYGQHALDIDPAAPDQLKTQIQRLIANPDWVNEPGVGFLEAFDVWVAIESIDALPTLTQWLGQGPHDPVLGHAAYLTLERLIDRSNTETLTALTDWSDSRLSGDLAKRRAALWARAPLEQSAGVALAESYLLNPALTPTERAAFYAQVPNLHFSHSHNLLSHGVYPDANTIRARLQSTREWLIQRQRDTRFSTDKAEIETALQRLQGILGSPSMTQADQD